MTAARSLPVVDLARFRDPRADHDEFLARLRGAAHDVGFFVVGHGVPEAVTAGVLDASRRRAHLVATGHRDVSPRLGVDRCSIPFFLGPRQNAVVEPMALPPALAAQAGGVTADPDNPLLPGYGENALVGWLGSHPRAAEMWWADVLARRS